MNLSSGTWRLYESINARDIEKAKKLLQHKLIDGNIKSDKIDSEWKSILQKPECRAERKFLLDLDDCDESQKDAVIEYLEQKRIHFFEQYETLSGFHIITEKFDIREIKEIFSFIDIKRDDMKLVKVVNI